MVRAGNNSRTKLSPRRTITSLAVLVGGSAKPTQRVKISMRSTEAAVGKLSIGGSGLCKPGADSADETNPNQRSPGRLRICADQFDGLHFGNPRVSAKFAVYCLPLTLTIFTAHPRDTDRAARRARRR